MSYNRIGKDGYDVPEYNPEEEKQVKLQDEVERDWEECENKEEVMEDYYPDRTGLDDPEDLYEGLDWKQKLEIYLDRNPEKNMDPECYPY